MASALATEATGAAREARLPAQRPVRTPTLLGAPLLLTMESLQRVRVRDPPHTSLPADNRRLYTTNPSVVALPKHYRRSLRAVYLAVIKVQNHHNCHRTMTRVPVPCVAMLGFQLLDAHFRAAPAREALVRFGEKPADGTCGRTSFEDCRLVALDAWLLLVCKTIVQRVHVALSDSTLAEAHYHCEPPLECRQGASERWTQSPTPQAPPRRGMQFVVSNAGLDLTLVGNQTHFATSEYFCGSSGRFCGKNFNLFVAPVEPESDERGLYVERWVLGPWRHGPQSPTTHFAPPTIDRLVQVAGARSSMSELEVRRRFPVFQAIRNPAKGSGRQLHQVIPMKLASSGLWEPEDGTMHSFEGYTMMGMTSPGKTGPKMPGTAHGGGCCVHIKADVSLGTPEVYVGVAHYHSAEYHYLQQFYAFRPEPPFDIFSLSDLFCFASPSGRRKSLLVHENVTYPCSAIQMTMSIAHRAGDRSTLVFGVGMNDCEARLAQMHTRDVVQMLFAHPSQQLLPR
ncbi:hypothetical protein AB1Y20_017597 [Prymnesium parvum]|uniref:Uncharacterized protein n=1 Tax=Prymnesium parvum TaxID=97485 RepID=A0AB34JKY9_PRYPA